MAEEFKDGDLVECISLKLARPDQIFVPLIILGGIYTISKTYIAKNNGELCLCLKEFPEGSNAQKAGWYAWRFRKVKPTDISILKKLLDNPIDLDMGLDDGYDGKIVKKKIVERV